MNEIAEVAGKYVEKECKKIIKPKFDAVMLLR